MPGVEARPCSSVSRFLGRPRWSSTSWAPPATVGASSSRAATAWATRRSGRSASASWTPWNLTARDALGRRVDELFASKTPILVGVEPRSLAVPFFQRGPDRTTKTWQEVLGRFPNLKEIASDQAPAILAAGNALGLLLQGDWFHSHEDPGGDRAALPQLQLGGVHQQSPACCTAGLEASGIRLPGPSGAGAQRDAVHHRETSREVAAADPGGRDASGLLAGLGPRSVSCLAPLVDAGTHSRSGSPRVVVAVKRPKANASGLSV